jgi:hypothetical protein
VPVAGRYAQAADAGLDEPARHLQRLLDVEAALGTLATRDPAEDGVVVAAARARGAHDLEQEACPVGQLAPVLVAALVDQRRQELARQVAVSGVDLDEVEAGFPTAGRRRRVLLDELVDVFARELARDRGARGQRHRRGRDGLAQVRLPAGVPELDPDRDALGVHRVHQSRQVRDELGVVQPQLRADGGLPWGDQARLHGDHADAATGSPPVVGDRGVVREALLARHAGAHREHHEAVRHGQTADAGRLEQQRRHAVPRLSNCRLVRFMLRPRPLNARAASGRGSRVVLPGSYSQGLSTKGLRGGAAHDAR